MKLFTVFFLINLIYCGNLFAQTKTDSSGVFGQVNSSAGTPPVKFPVTEKYGKFTPPKDCLEFSDKLKTCQPASCAYRTNINEIEIEIFHRITGETAGACSYQLGFKVINVDKKYFYFSCKLNKQSKMSMAEMLKVTLSGVEFTRIVSRCSKSEVLRSTVKAASGTTALNPATPPVREGTCKIEINGKSYDSVIRMGMIDGYCTQLK